MKPTVSIIIPVYNAETTLDRCLNSVLTQSLREIEVLCVNDGSTDGTGEALTRWEKQDGRVYVLSFEENKGIFLAVKAGILKSTGEYVMFVDSDDRLLPGACENAVRLIRKHEVDILQFGIKVNAQSSENESNWQKRFASKEWASEGINILYDCFTTNRFPYYIWNKIYRGEVCRAAGAVMPDLQVSFPADVLLTFSFLYYAKTFCIVTDGPYYEYFVGSGFSTRPLTVQQFNAWCKSSTILVAIEGFLKRENTLENNRFLVESIRAFLRRGVVNRLLSLPEITQETIDLAVKTWGSEVLYDFIKATGLIDVKCTSRYKLVPALVEQLRKQQNRPTTSAEEMTISVRGRTAAQPESGMYPAQK